MAGVTNRWMSSADAPRIKLFARTQLCSCTRVAALSKSNLWPVCQQCSTSSAFDRVVCVITSRSRLCSVKRVPRFRPVSSMQHAVQSWNFILYKTPPWESGGVRSMGLWMRSGATKIFFWWVTTQEISYQRMRFDCEVWEFVLFVLKTVKYVLIN